MCDEISTFHRKNTIKSTMELNMKQTNLLNQMVKLMYGLFMRAYKCPTNGSIVKNLYKLI
jgi:hypothetical protein